MAAFGRMRSKRMRKVLRMNFDLADILLCTSHLGTYAFFTSFIQIPVVCGGREIYRGDSDLCYTYEPYLDSWTPAGALLVPRHEAGCAVASDYGLVISGGFDDLETVEYTGNDCS